MKHKQTYLQPSIRIVALRYQHQLLGISGQSGKPSASYMRDPGIGESDDEYNYE